MPNIVTIDILNSYQKDIYIEIAWYSTLDKQRILRKYANKFSKKQL